MSQKLLYCTFCMRLERLVYFIAQLQLHRLVLIANTHTHTLYVVDVLQPFVCVGGCSMCVSVRVTVGSGLILPFGYEIFGLLLALSSRIAVLLSRHEGVKLQLLVVGKIVSWSN